MTGEGSLRRRGFLRSACRHCAALGALGCLPALAQAPSSQPLADRNLPRFPRPSLDSDEGGLWAMMDREETRLRRSPFVLRDPGISAYLAAVMCRIGGEHCRDIRVHVVRTPLFNASMAPNGMMQVWTGLLLRVENEAQLVAILGHELGHYLERHTLERLRDVKSRTAFAQFIGMFGVVGMLGQLGVLASAFAFSRDQESRADQIGMKLMQAAGYDGRQAAQVWDNLIGEMKVRAGEQAGKTSPMMATHPASATRRDDLLKLAGDTPGESGAAAYRRTMAPHRMDWIEDEIRRGQYEESLVLFDRLLVQDPGDAQIRFGRGEVCRQRADAGDLDRALADLSQAAGAAGTPPQAFRSLGLLQRQRGERAAAVTAFEAYLAQVPGAGDAALIAQYISELKP